MKPQSGFESGLLGAFAAALIVVIALSAITWKMAEDAAVAGRWVRHSQEVQAALARVQVDTALVELNTQSFRVTGDPARLVDRDAAIASREADLQALQAQTADNPVQIARWTQLRDVVSERLFIARKLEQLRKFEGAEAANAFAAKSPLAQTRSRVQKLLSDMEAEERRLLEERGAEQLAAGRRLVAAGATASIALLALLSGTYLVLRRQLRQNEAGRKALAASEAQWAITLNSIGDGVVTADAQGILTHMNPVAERLTGWPVAEARGLAVERVVVTVDQLTREHLPLPVAEVLATGCTHELAGRTALIGRHGDECPVADSVAPIRDAAGSVCGVVMVLRDETSARLAENTIREQNAQLERRVLERTAQLRSSEQQLARVLEGADEGYWDWNLQTNEFRVSERLETMLGYEPGEMRVAPEHWPEIVHPDDLPGAMASIERHRAGLVPLHEAEFRCRTRQDEWRWILTRGRVVERDEGGTPRIMSGTHTDITDRKRAELAQRESAVVFDNSYEGIMVANTQGLITKVNPAFTRITGYTEDEVVGRSPSLLASGMHDVAFYEAFWASLTHGGHWHGEIWNRRKTGELYATLQSVSAVYDANGQVLHYISVFADITHLKTHAAELDRVANYDALTGLPNRRLLSDRIQQILQRSQRSGKSSAVCFLDLDGFKAINDRLGHAAGDQMLVGVATNLKSALRGEDTLARLGGDEFVILLSEVDSLKDGAAILDRILHAVRLPVQVDGHLLSTTASIGVSLFPNDNVDPDTLLRHADQTMYLAKQAGKNRYQLFDPEVDRSAQHRREQLERLRAALRNGELLLHYQPKVDLTNGNIIGTEALLRWIHPERGLLLPAEFLPQMQGSDVEHDLGNWVIDSALRQSGTWAAQGLHIPVSVNIGARHLLGAGFCDELALALQRHPGVKPSHLELEILESAAINDLEQAERILHDSIALGVRFSLDDFGTGYSSLTYLRKLPVHTLKIDQSFVRNMLADPEDLGIVRGVIDLANAFKRQVIAEGVETMMIGHALVGMGCRYAQGYGIARPMPPQDMPAWCEAWTRDRTWQLACVCQQA